MSNVTIIAFIVVIALGLVYWSQSKRTSGADSVQQGIAFLEQNKNADGVVVTASGLQYRVLQAGHGTRHPTAADRVKVHYHGTLVDGTVFDSSVARGEAIEFNLDQVIRGWTEGLQLMVVGEKTRLFIPSELAYGNRRAGKIKPGSVLIFDVELLEIM
jgi:peptidylprolyl isomerase